MINSENDYNPIRVILVDDHQIIRDGLKALLKDRNEVQVVGEAGNGNELMALLPQVEADVIMMDINMPEMDGFDTTAYLHEKYKNLKILI